ncbi:glucose/arabinose dehydrogenase [Bradyrhizobium sp. LM2.9]
MKNRISLVAISAGWLVAIATSAQAEPVLQGRDAYGDWQADKPGTVRLIRPQDLAKPRATPSVASFSRVVPRPPEAALQVPAGFKIELFAGGLRAPRIIRVAPNGDVFVAETRAGNIRVLRAGEGGKVATNEVFASGLRQPFGIAFFPGGDNPQWVYVANTDSVVRIPYQAGDLKARGKAETIVASLPHDGGHSTRDIVFTPDNKRMLVSVGSLSNVAEGMGTPAARIGSVVENAAARRRVGERDRPRHRARLQSRW